MEHHIGIKKIAMHMDIGDMAATVAVVVILFNPYVFVCKTMFKFH